MTNWKDIHPDFATAEELGIMNFWENTYYQQSWEKEGFTYQDAKILIRIGFKPQELVNAKQWKNQGFTPKEVKQWLYKGLNKKNSYLAKFLSSKGYTPVFFPSDSRLNELKENYLSSTNDWSIIHDDFTEKKGYYDKTNQQEWKTKEFTYQEAQDWVKAGFEPKDYNWVKKWKVRNFEPQIARKWIKEIGLKPKDVFYCTHLRNIKENEKEYQN